MELLTAMYLLSLPFIFKIVYLFFIVVPFFKKTRRLYYKIFSYPLTEDNILLHDKDYLFMDLFLSLERKNVKSLRKGFDMFITYIFFFNTYVNFINFYNSILSYINYGLFV